MISENLLLTLADRCALPVMMLSVLMRGTTLSCAGVDGSYVGSSSSSSIFSTLIFRGLPRFRFSVLTGDGAVMSAASAFRGEALGDVSSAATNSTVTVLDNCFMPLDNFTALLVLRGA